MKNLLKGYFYYSYFTPNFWNRYFAEFIFLAGDRKTNKIYRRKLKAGDRFWELELLIGNYVFTGNYFA